MHDQNSAVQKTAKLPDSRLNENCLKFLFFSLLLAEKLEISIKGGQTWGLGVVVGFK